MPPVETQMACPFATESDPLCAVVMQDWVNPTEMVVVMLAGV